MVGWILFGLLTGLFVYLFEPQPRASIGMSVILGIAGGILGGILATLLFGASTREVTVTLFVAIAGALILLFLHRAMQNI